MPAIIENVTSGTQFKELVINASLARIIQCLCDVVNLIVVGWEKNKRHKISPLPRATDGDGVFWAFCL